MRRALTLSSQRKIAVMVLCASLVTVALLAYFAVVIATRAVENQARERVSASADVSSRYVAEQVEGYSVFVDSYATRPFLLAAMNETAPGGRNTANVTSQLEQMVVTGGFAVAAVLDMDGRLLAVYPPEPGLIGKTFSHRDYFRGVTTTRKPYVSEVFNGAVSGYPRLVAAASLIRDGDMNGPRGRDLGVVVGTVRTTAIQDFTESFAEAQGISLSVTDQRGVLVAAERGVPEALEPQRDPRVQAALEGESKTLRMEPVGEEVLTSYRPVPSLGWTVSASVPVRTALADVVELRNMVLGVALALSLVLGGTLWWLMRALARSEQRLRSKVSELEAANRTLDAFSHTLVHDLRNPLTAIGGFATTLRTVLVDADEQVRAMTSHIESSAERMHGLIEDVLALATAARPAEKKPCDPAVVLREAAEDVPRIELELGWLPESIDADRAGLFRCFQNLFENASHYAVEDDGVAHVRVWADENPWHWRFFVEDHGPGISEADAKRVFEAFQRGTGALPGTGTGLGLSIVAATAQAHGGSVAVEYGDGGGARFVMEIAKPRKSGRPIPQ